MLIKAELDDISVGLETLGVLSPTKESSQMRPLFIAYQYHLSADIMQDLFHVYLSPTGSNLRQREEEISLYWINFLQKIESNDTVTSS